MRDLTESYDDEIKIIKKGAWMNCEPGTVWDAYEDIYNNDMNRWVGRIWQCGDTFETNHSNKKFKTLKSAANYCYAHSQNESMANWRTKWGKEPLMTIPKIMEDRKKRQSSKPKRKIIKKKKGCGCK